MKGHNQCRWLMDGSLELCAKSCVFEHCGHHRAQIRKGSATPKPCRRCGRGVRSATGLCLGCGRHKVAQKLISIRVKAGKQYKKVVDELNCREFLN